VTYTEMPMLIIWLDQADQQIIALWDTVRQGTNLRNNDVSSTLLQSSFDHFLGNSWFFKIWTLQDVLLAPMAVAFCGNHWVEWRRLLERLPAIGPLCSLQDCKRLNNYPIPTPSSSPLTQMILATRHRGATDHRDKIYALLGLLPAADINIIPSYNTTPSQPFADVDRRLLHACGSGWRPNLPSNASLKYLIY
jgi:hypothetical protein